MFPKKGTRSIVIDNNKFDWRVNDREHNVMILCAHSDYHTNFIEITTNYVGDGFWLNPVPDENISFDGFGPALVRDIILKAIDEGWKFHTDKGYRYKYDQKLRILIRC